MRGGFQLIGVGSLAAAPVVGVEAIDGARPAAFRCGGGGGGWRDEFAICDVAFQEAIPPLKTKTNHEGGGASRAAVVGEIGIDKIGERGNPHQEQSGLQMLEASLHHGAVWPCCWEISATEDAVPRPDGNEN